MFGFDLDILKIRWNLKVGLFSTDQSVTGSGQLADEQSNVAQPTDPHVELGLSDNIHVSKQDELLVFFYTIKLNKSLNYRTYDLYDLLDSLYVSNI